MDSPQGSVECNAATASLVTTFGKLPRFVVPFRLLAGIAKLLILRFLLKLF
jgi:hypothetical protein